MAEPTSRPPQIHPAMRVVMRLPGNNKDVDPWTGAERSHGPNHDESDPAFDENVGLMPPLGKTPGEVEAELSPPPRLDNPYVDPYAEPAGGPWYQFSIKELIFLTTLVAVGAAAARVLPPAPLACLVGVITFAVMWFTSAVQVRKRWVHVTCWGLLAMYLVTTMVALVRSWST
jgi:hypothetical protein